MSQCAVLDAINAQCLYYQRVFFCDIILGMPPQHVGDFYLRLWAAAFSSSSVAQRLTAIGSVTSFSVGSHPRTIIRLELLARGLLLRRLFVASFRISGRRQRKYFGAAAHAGNAGAVAHVGTAHGVETGVAGAAQARAACANCRKQKKGQSYARRQAWRDQAAGK